MPSTSSADQSASLRDHLQSFDIRRTDISQQITTHDQDLLLGSIDLTQDVENQDPNVTDTSFENNNVAFTEFERPDDSLLKDNLNNTESESISFPGAQDYTWPSTNSGLQTLRLNQISITDSTGDLFSNDNETSQVDFSQRNFTAEG